MVTGLPSERGMVGLQQTANTDSKPLIWRFTLVMSCRIRYTALSAGKRLETRTQKKSRPRTTAECSKLHAKFAELA